MGLRVPAEEGTQIATRLWQTLESRWEGVRRLHRNSCRPPCASGRQRTRWTEKPWCASGCPQVAAATTLQCLLTRRSSADGRMRRNESPCWAMTLFIFKLTYSILRPAFVGSCFALLFPSLSFSLPLLPIASLAASPYHSSFIFLQYPPRSQRIHDGCYSLPLLCSRCPALRGFGYSQSCWSCGLHPGPRQGYSS